MDSLKLGLSRNYIKASFRISDEELDAVIEYIEQHKEEVERDYAVVLRRAAELEAHYRKIQAERSPFPPDMPLEERQKLMRERIKELNETGGFYGPAALTENAASPRAEATQHLDDYEVCMMAYLALGYLENGEQDKLPKVLAVAPADLEKIYQYIAEHREEMERDTERIRRGLN
jgi:hypothetical protein